MHGLGPSRDNSPGGANEDAINFGAAGLFGLAAMARMDNAIPMDLLGAMADMSGELSFTANAAGNFQTGIGSPGGSGDGDPPGKKEPMGPFSDDGSDPSQTTEDQPNIGLTETYEVDNVTKSISSPLGDKLTIGTSTSTTVGKEGKYITGNLTYDAKLKPSSYNITILNVMTTTVDFKNIGFGLGVKLGSFEFGNGTTLNGVTSHFGVTGKSETQSINGSFRPGGGTIIGVLIGVFAPEFAPELAAPLLQSLSN